VMLALTVRRLSMDRPGYRGPHTLQDAGRIAESLGLFHRSDTAEGVPTCRLIVSETPLTFERAGAIVLREPTHPSLLGTVAVYSGAHAMGMNYDPTCSAIWGDLFVYGDPAVILKLLNAD